ncbi:MULTISPECIES: DUF2517 family protein [Aliagarivorans]|uniref:DUF2517 family protein n=1 Tax=Aliagarivorans TaxID=882379 RepID=UPI00055007CB|nr:MULTISPECIES: DUF2517 family protein [Aliagarivorans]
MTKSFSALSIVSRRVGLVSLGIVSFPFVAMAGLRKPFYSFIHRQWIKRNDKPSWLQQAEKSVEHILF